jgi:hypothetical protein
MKLEQIQCNSHYILHQNTNVIVYHGAHEDYYGSPLFLLITYNYINVKINW